MKPTFLSPFLGAGAEWLHLLSPDLVPPVSWMGGKRRLAREILALLELHPRQDVPCVLGDASWWGWVWPTCLDPVTGPEVSAMLRLWRGCDPRALWFWLRDVGPMESRAEAAAQLLWLQARAASGVPVWWDGTEVLAAPGRGRDRQRAADRGANGLRLVATTHGNGQPPGAPYAAGCKDSLLASDGRGVPREAGHKGLAPRIVQWSEDGGTRPNAGKGYHGGGRDGKRGGGIVDPDTIADRLDSIRWTLVKASGGSAAPGPQDGWCAMKGWRALQPDDVATRVDAIRAAQRNTVILHTDAFSLTEEWAPRVGAGGRWYFDPPYQGATGYPASCPRDEVLRIADTAARHGGRVVLSEAVGLAAELGRGWSQVQLRDGRKPEWVTLYGCDVRAHLPPLLRMMA